MANIGDLYYAFRGDGARLMADAKREGEKAGAVGGKSFGAKFKSGLLGSELKKGLMQGLGIGGGLGVANVVAAGIGAIGDAFTKTIADAIAFEKAMANVNSIAKFTDAELAEASDAVLKLSGDFGQSAQTMAEGLYDISSSGFKGVEALKVLEAATKAATAGLATTAQSASGVTAVLNAYGLSAEDAGRVSDVLFETVNRGVITFPELADQIGKTTALSAPLGVSLEEVAAATALMTRNGVGAEETLTQINAIMVSMLKPSVEAAATAEELGLQWNSAGLRANGLVGSIQQLINKTGGSHEKMATLLGDSRAIRGAFVLAKNSGKDFADELGFMADAAGATSEAFAIQSKSTAFRMAQMNAKIEAAGIALGESFLPVLSAVADLMVKDVVPAMEEFADALDEIKTGAADNEKPLGNLANILHDLFKDTDEDANTFIGSVFDGLNTLEEGLDSFASNLNDAWTFWDTYTDHAEDARIEAERMPETLRETSRGLMQMEASAAAAEDDLGTAGTALGKMADKAEIAGEDVEDAAVKMRDAVRKYRDDLIDAARGVVTTAYQIIADKAELAAATVESAELRKVIATGKATSAQKARYKELGETQAQLILDLADNGQRGMNEVNKAVDDIRERLKTATGQERKALLATLAVLKRIATQAKITAGQISNITGNVGAYSMGPSGGKAHGGFAPAGVPTWTGELGKELVVPMVDSYVIDHTQSMKLADGGGGGDTINLSLTGLPLQAESPADVVRELRRASRLGLTPRRRPRGFSSS